MSSKIPMMRCNFPQLPSRSSNSKIPNSGTECKVIREPIREGRSCRSPTQSSVVLCSTPDTGAGKNLMPDGMTCSRIWPRIYGADFCSMCCWLNACDKLMQP